MVFAIDIGNSTTTIGLYGSDGILKFRSDLATNREASRDQCAISLMGVFTLYQADIHSVTGTMMSSVVPSLTGPMFKAIRTLTGKPPMVMGPGVKTGLNIKSDIHTQMGSDIVACSIAAIAKYPSPVIVIDMGTAVTMSYLRGHTYEGCVIMPGIHVALEALSERAAELPHISIARPPSIFGHNTVDAMRSGVVYGNASMIDGMIQRLEDASAPAAAVVATGSNTYAVLRECKRDILFDANLLLDGLYLVYKKNTEAKPKKP